MTEPLVKQIVDLKEEHTLMLETLQLVEWVYSIHREEWVCAWCEEERVFGHKPECVRQISIKAAEDGNERRANGNVDLPDRRGIKVNG